jgi:hypothetical protein
MTRDEIMALTGRELDAAVAELLFGWRWFVDSAGNEVGEAWMYSPEVAAKISADSGIVPASPGAPRYYSGIPSYSSNWLGLGLVVEAMKQRGWGVSIVGPLPAPARHERWYSAEFAPARRLARDVPMARHRNTRSPTAPQAVARAALLALLSEATP